MAFRSPFAISRRLLSGATPSARPLAWSCAAYNKTQRSTLATVVPPVTQDATGSKGPTAMVFMNMGGPSTTNEVEDFLSRLFVCSFGIDCCFLIAAKIFYWHWLISSLLLPIIGRW
jgi:ferrochelatase